MSESIAERALLAHKADQEAKRLRNEAQIVALRAQAVDAIVLEAEKFGLTIDVDDIEPASCSTEVTSRFTAKWWIVVPVDDDLAIKIEWANRPSEGFKIVVTAQYPDQLYWDLPPQETEKGPGGGSYACFGLRKGHDVDVITSLGDIGKQIVLTRKAREQWRKKWAAKGANV